MRDMSDGGNVTTARQETASGPTWLGAGGLVLLAVGLLGAVVLWSETGEEGTYSAVDRWLAVLGGLTVAGIGLTVLGVAAILNVMVNRRD